MLTELTIKEFINKVISNDPVPGGGSVSALNGALAGALAAMVANLTIVARSTQKSMISWWNCLHVLKNCLRV